MLDQKLKLKHGRISVELITKFLLRYAQNDECHWHFDGLLKQLEEDSNKEYHTFAEKLAAEIMDASKNQGEAVRKREVALKQAEANMAFSSFRW